MIKAKKEAFTVLEMLVVVGVIAIVSAIIIPNLFMARMTANEAAAKSNLRSIAAAAETLYASKNHYPDDLTEFENFLQSARTFCADLNGTKSEYKGYDYSCTSDVNGYTFEASPVTLGMTGSITYTVTTGGILTPL
ncbi:MAG: prepilin-type N-terminal cleavage/methylation domain-containing protein [Candidatus Omnitrophota bacterium]|jgi:prepilin-type N-terminal cleavage/methylation domain-containing protein